MPPGGVSSSECAKPPSVEKAASSSPDERLDTLALALIPDVGPRAYRERSAAFGSPARAFNATVGPRDRAALREEAERVATDGEQCGARLLLIDDADYPPTLRHLFDPPPFLFVIGDLALAGRPCVAIVGTRRATVYGERATTALTAGLADAGVCIVSGMARGIDSAAHRAALARKGATIAVLGTGIDIAYPTAHRSLHQAIGERGLLVSEFPCGARPGKYAFPRRNRIIAALAALTIVVEAGEKSGALITSDHATDLGREIGAVPGPIDSPQSVGTNRLIRKGAHPILQADDALALIGLRDHGVRPFPVDPVLYGDERVVWNALASGAAPIDWVVAHSALEPKRALAAVTALELSGLIETSPLGELRRLRG